MATVAELEERLNNFVESANERIKDLQDKLAALQSYAEELNDDFAAQMAGEEYEVKTDKNGNFVEMVNPEHNAFALTVDANGKLLKDPNRNVPVG